MAEHTISLRALRQHVLALNRLVEDAFAHSDSVAPLNFTEVRAAARGIMALVGDDAEPAAQDNERKADAHKRAAYQRAAADSRKAPTFDLPAILGLSHIRKGGRP